MVDHAEYLRRFLAAGGTLEQVEALHERMSDALTFHEITGVHYQRVHLTTGMNPEAAAIMREWTAASVAEMRGGD